jgi:Tfp pilus assembly pilus retraction ATPase PilT
MTADINSILEKAVQMKASDVHIKVGSLPIVMNKKFLRKMCII